LKMVRRYIMFFKEKIPYSIVSMKKPV